MFMKLLRSYAVVIAKDPGYVVVVVSGFQVIISGVSLPTGPTRKQPQLSKLILAELIASTSDPGNFWRIIARKEIYVDLNISGFELLLLVCK
jgi:hypothetical protein